MQLYKLFGHPLVSWFVGLSVFWLMVNPIFVIEIFTAPAHIYVNISPTSY